MSINFKYNFIIIALISFLFNQKVAAQADIESIDFSSIKTERLFSSDDILELTLKADFVSIFNDIGENPQEHEGRIEFTDDLGEFHSIPLKVRTRGHFRKNPCNCSFPPLKINFKKKRTADTEFEGQDKIKLVTHCNSRKEVYEQYILQEYLVYKSYNLITEKSFKVRLARITYSDINGAVAPVNKIAFFIESTSSMANRIGGEELEIKNIHNDRTDYEAINLLSVFQYMIGNTDWSVPNLHNIKLISIDITQPPVAVPYDFDWSGMVNTNYAEPAQMLGLTTVRERIFRGYARTEDELNATFEVFNEQKEAIFDLYRNCELLDEKQKKLSLSYLDEFYKTIGKEKAVFHVFIRGARSNDFSQK